MGERRCAVSFLSGPAFISYGNKLGGFKRCALDLPATNGPHLMGRVGALRQTPTVMYPLVNSLTH